jgi:hypothetical protein
MAMPRRQLLALILTVCVLIPPFFMLKQRLSNEAFIFILIGFALITMVAEALFSRWSR